MTTAERYIRTLREQAKSAVIVQRDAALKAVVTEVSRAKLPPRVRQAFADYRSHLKAANAAKARVERAGFHVYNFTQKKMSRKNADRDKARIRLKADQRLAEINNLAFKANVDCLGTDQRAAARVIKQFQSDILKVK